MIADFGSGTLVTLHGLEAIVMKPLRYSEQNISEDDIAAVVRVLRSDWLTQGPEVERFEAALCEYTGAKYAVAVSSGTAALHLAMTAHADDTCQPVTSPLSFVASANAMLLALQSDGEPGWSEVAFADVESATGNVDFSTAKHAAVAGGYGLYVPVHYAGRAAKITTPKHWTIEDASHALGAMDFDGYSRVGSCANSLATCFSFHPSSRSRPEKAGL